MNASDAYQRALALWGDEAAVWKAGDGRYVVGHWVALAETNGEGRETVILRTSSKGLLVRGQGEDWADAFLDAELRGPKT